MFVLIKNINGIPTYQDQVTGQIVEGVPIGGLYSTAGAVHVRLS